MSERRSPAVALFEFSSIVEGVNSADAIAKGTPIDLLYTGTTHPGKYVVLVAGDTASVVVATEIISDLGVDLVDTVFIPDIDPTVTDAMVRSDTAREIGAEAVGLVETTTISSGVDAADAAVKAADVLLAAIVMADGIHGKAYFIVEGEVGEVEAAILAGDNRAGSRLVASVVIPQITDELREDLEASSLFVERVRSHRTED